MPSGHLDRAAPRARAIEAGLPLAHRLARGYAGRGEAIDDLRQVAAMALVKSIDRFDPARLADFACFATPTILGEIKRHFRDNIRMVRIPRGSQEMTRAASMAGDELGHRLA